MSNVVRLFKEEEPVIEAGPLSEVMDKYIAWARERGVDVDGAKFLYACTTIMTLMEIEAR